MAEPADLPDPSTTETPEPTAEPSQQQQQPQSPPAGLRSRLEGMAPLPQFPSFPIRRRPQGPSQPDSPDPAEPATIGSFPGSTDPPKAAEPPPELSAKDLKDLQSAIAQAVDIGFVWAGQLMGTAEKRAKGLDHVDPKWTPTVAERRFVSDPAGRIARRHVHADATALDTVDGLLIAIGIGAFGTRRAFNIDPLDQEPQP